jgi:hypothetical protein
MTTLLTCTYCCSPEPAGCYGRSWGAAWFVPLAMFLLLELSLMLQHTCCVATASSKDCVLGAVSLSFLFVWE